MNDTIDVCMPTYNGGAVIGTCLGHLHDAIADSPFDLGALRISDGGSTDDTPRIIREWADEHSHALDLQIEGTSLPVARERLIGRVTTDWFLFLDDDVLVDGTYLSTLASWTDEGGVGAVHGRKANAYFGPPSEWKRMRATRGATHATLFRTAAVAGTTVPADLHVLEDEYLRRVVENRGWNWVFDHRALLEHQNQGRHAPNFQAGWLAGKYGLLPGWYCVLHPLYAIARRRDPMPHTKRALGWIAGALSGHLEGGIFAETYGVPDGGDLPYTGGKQLP